MVKQEDTIFITGMPEHVQENDIAQHFGSIGVIKVSWLANEAIDIRVIADLMTPSNGSVKLLKSIGEI